MAGEGATRSSPEAPSVADFISLKTSAPVKWSRRISAARIRLLYQIPVDENYFYFIGTIGAVATGAISHVWGSSPLPSIVIWVSMVLFSELLLMAPTEAFRRAHREDGTLPTWAWRRVLVASAFGAAWGFGPIMLYVPGQPATLLAPAWAIMIMLFGVIYSAGPHLPTLFIVLITSLAPAATQLYLLDDGHERPVGILMYVGLIFVLAIGAFAWRAVGQAISSRLEIEELEQRQRAIQRELRDSIAERNRFFSAASHDLRQPLHALGFYANLISKSKNPAELEDLQYSLSECIVTLDNQFNAIIGIAEIDSFVERASVQAHSVNTLLRRVVRGLLPSAKARGIAIREIPSSLWVQGDAEILARALTNILSNAIKYTPSGKVLVGARRRGGSVRICVVDTGIGIAEEHQTKIFADFYQVGNFERSRENGYGLGLSIVRRLCEAMGWTLEVRSRLGKGSLFAIGVPLIQPAGSQPEPGPRTALEEERPLSLNVLIVDDDPVVRDATSKVIERWGARAHGCQRGAEAIEFLSTQDSLEKWHVLLDYRLADGESGLDIADSLKDLHGDQIRITLLSGETREDVVKEAKSRGIGLLRKPVKPIRLRAALSQR